MKVTFRPLRPNDAARVFAWRNRPEVAAHMYADHLITDVEHRAWLERALAGGDRHYWIIEADAAPVGLANVVRINPVARRCELGHYIANTALRGLGIGACVEYFILQQVFTALKLNKLWCEVLVENQAAWRLHESFGFRREAHFRDHVFKGGRFRDVFGLGVLADEWEALRPACEARLLAKGYDIAALSAGGG